MAKDDQAGTPAEAPITISVTLFRGGEPVEQSQMLVVPYGGNIRAAPGLDALAIASAIAGLGQAADAGQLRKIS